MHADIRKREDGEIRGHGEPEREMRRREMDAQKEYGNVDKVHHTNYEEEKGISSKLKKSNPSH